MEHSHYVNVLYSAMIYSAEVQSRYSLYGSAVIIIFDISQECSNVFSVGGGESLAEETKVPFLGKVQYMSCAIKYPKIQM